MNTAPLFFLHFPRAAGTTLDSIFFNNYSREEIIRIYTKEDYAKYRYIDPDSLAKIKYITGHVLLDSCNPTIFYERPVRAFVFLRHPVDRLVSEYKFLKSWKNNHLYNYLNSKNISFREYITSTEKILVYRGKNFMTRCISSDPLENIENPDDSLEKAKYNLLHSFFFFGLQERFMESLLLLSEKIGLKNILHQKHNSLIKDKLNIEITSEDLKIAAEFNSQDIELYNFALKEFDAIIAAQDDNFKMRLKNYIFLNKKYQKMSELIYNMNNQDEISSPIHMPKTIKW